MVLPSLRPRGRCILNCKIQFRTLPILGYDRAHFLLEGVTCRAICTEEVSLVLCDANAVWRNFDTESAETRAKPNRPDGRFSASPATRKFALRTKNTDELKRAKLRAHLPRL